MIRYDMIYKVNYLTKSIDELSPKIKKKCTDILLSITTNAVKLQPVASQLSYQTPIFSEKYYCFRIFFFSLLQLQTIPNISRQYKNPNLQFTIETQKTSETATTIP